eukprot:scaffold211421_cov17-Prasinocladus_malaysianus.AAC.1
MPTPSLFTKSSPVLRLSTTGEGMLPVLSSSTTVPELAFTMTYLGTYQHTAMLIRPVVMTLQE